MEYGVDIAVESPRKKLIDEFCLVEIIDDFAVNKILEFVGAGQVVDRNDLIHTALVERLDDIGTNKSGCAGNDGVHKFSSVQHCIECHIQFGPCNHRRTEFANNNARCDIGHMNRLRPIGAMRQHDGQRGDNGITRTRHIKHFTSHSWLMSRPGGMK